MGTHCIDQEAKRRMGQERTSETAGELSGILMILINWQMLCRSGGGQSGEAFQNELMSYLSMPKSRRVNL